MKKIKISKLGILFVVIFCLIIIILELDARFGYDPNAGYDKKFHGFFQFFPSFPWSILAWDFVKTSIFDNVIIYGSELLNLVLLYLAGNFIEKMIIKIKNL